MKNHNNGDNSEFNTRDEIEVHDDGPIIRNKLDKLDVRIMTLMNTGIPNKDISVKLKVPLSTVQRRTKRLIKDKIITMKAEFNIALLGIKRGNIHVYLNNGDMEGVVDNLLKVHTISSVEVHIGNSDLIGNVLYRTSRQLLKTIYDIKHIDGVEKVVWSEEVYNVYGQSDVLTDLLRVQ